MFYITNDCHQESFETGAPEQVEDCKACRQSKTLMSEPLLSRTEALSGYGAVSRLPNPLDPMCLNSDSHFGKTADCAGTKKKILYILCVIVWYWLAKDTERRVVCS